MKAQKGKGATDNPRGGGKRCLGTNKNQGGRKARVLTSSRDRTGRRAGPRDLELRSQLQGLAFSRAVSACSAGDGTGEASTDRKVVFPRSDPNRTPSPGGGDNGHVPHTSPRPDTSRAWPAAGGAPALSAAGAAVSAHAPAAGGASALRAARAPLGAHAPTSACLNLASRLKGEKKARTKFTLRQNRAIWRKAKRPGRDRCPARVTEPYDCWLYCTDAALFVTVFFTVLFVCFCLRRALIAEGWLSSCRAPTRGRASLGSCGSRAPERRLSTRAHGLGCPLACGPPDQGLRPCLLPWRWVLYL